MNAAKNTIRIISVLNAYYRHITKIMRIACVLKAYWLLIKSAPMYVNIFFWDFRLWKNIIALYMKSGLYITEIVKRLYQSEQMKKQFPDPKERLRHIFEK